MLFHLACIVVMVALLNATLLKPINRILEERERRTGGRLTEAQRTVQAAEEKWREYERRLREARSQGYALMEQERAAVSRDREERVAEVKSDVARWLTEEKERLRADEESAKSKLASEATSTALEISRRILRRPVG